MSEKLGEAGLDYPNYHDIPQTKFECAGKIAGYYADVEARCQVCPSSVLNDPMNY